MARVIFSPLISSLSGKVADAVFATWKGRPYVRERVIPENPQTASQQAVRDALSESVALWQALSALRQNAFDLGASGLAISGYNDMVGRNRSHVQAEDGLFGPRYNPDATDPRLDIPTDLAYDSEPGAGQATFTWTDPGQGADYMLGYIAYDSTDNVLHADWAGDVLMSAETITISGLTAAHNYLYAFIVRRESDDEFRHAQHAYHLQIA